MIKKFTLLLLCLNALALLAFYFLDHEALNQPLSDKTVPVELHDGAVSIQLRHRPFTVFEFPAKVSPPVGVILLASGDGGWGAWEETVSQSLQANGFTVVGINSNDYAKTDYDLATLQADWNTIAQSVRDQFPNSPPRVIVSGWSMGAAQAIAVAGGPDRPKGLVGVLVASLFSRGRYGLRISDEADILPTGPGTFAMTDFASGMNGLRIVQWHAVGDRDDSTAWLSKLKTIHREIDFKNAGHDFNGASPEFMQKFAESALWILK